MNSRILALSTLTLALLSQHSLAQPSTVERTALGTEAASLYDYSSSGNNAASSSAYVTRPPSPDCTARTYRPFSALGFASQVGLAGAGFDVASPLATRFNLRIGMDFFSYTATFQEQGANVGIDLHMRSGHASLDWFPFGRHFRLSPQLVFGNNNRILATAIIPSGSSITLNGKDYISSFTDPLHGSGRIGFRKVSPGLSLGFGNVIPRTNSHFSVPVELGFYYAGQPSLQVAFTGSACDPNYSPSTGCESVNQDSGFQQDLSAFKARNNHNLSYASFFPIASIGVGYRFW